MTDRPFDSRHSGEVSCAGQGDADSLSLGLRAIVQHARQLTHAPARESTERFGRERLLAAAGLRARPPRTINGAANPFAGRGVWARLFGRLRDVLQGDELASRRTWGAVAALACVAVAGYFGYSGLHVGATQNMKSLAAMPLAAAPSADAPLTYSTSGGQPAASNYLVAPAHSSASLRFSDGTEVTAAPGSRLRVDSTQSNGARVLLEQGAARAHVTHREDTRWMFVAGPFDVRITGTTFSLSWDAADQVLDLTLHEGSVEVESPLGASHLKVKTGQRFHASVTEGTMQLLAADSNAPAAHGGADAASEAVPAGDEPTSSKASARSRARNARAVHLAQRRSARAERRAPRQTDREADRESNSSNVQLAAASYADLVRAGAFEQVVDAATQAGLAQTLEKNNAEDVRALADAARYLHRTELAVRSLTVLRARFPGSHHSAAAAFLLGRTYENAEQAQAARRFYELYERESPNGEFAAEALAGRMRVIASVDGKEASRAIAQQYLDRYPRGVHAKTARQLLH
jgi:TolA-binding protein